MEAPGSASLHRLHGGGEDVGGARRRVGVLGARAVDADHEIERRLGTSIDEYWESDGEAAFRAVEEQVVCGLLERPPEPVLSLGGGAVGSARVRELLRRHTVVLLDVDVETAWHRAGNKRRPLARDRERFVALHARRTPVYEALADAVLLDSSREEVRQGGPRRCASIAGAARSCCGRRPPPAATRCTWGRGCWGAGSGRSKGGASRSPMTPSALSTASPRRPRRSRSPPASSTRRSRPSSACCASWRPPGWTTTTTWRRSAAGSSATSPASAPPSTSAGCKVVQVPTTLVAQVDSAYGGKTGVDLPEGKNYAGAYHQPAAVLVDPATMATLPQAELAAGWAEVIKTALIAGGRLWERVRAGAALDRDLVLACARTKLAVVASDERDSGRRQILNLGHTVGHAIETVTGYRRYRHGEAVGLGLLAALQLSDQSELRAEVAALLAARGLPTELDRSVDAEAVVAATARDKKRRGGRVGFVLVEAPGDVRPGRPVADGELRRAVAELRAA